MEKLKALLVKAFGQEPPLEVAVDDGDGELQSCASIEEVLDIVNSVDEATVYIDNEGMVIVPSADGDEIVDYETGGWIEQNLG